MIFLQHGRLRPGSVKQALYLSSVAQAELAPRLSSSAEEAVSFGECHDMERPSLLAFDKPHQAFQAMSTLKLLQSLAVFGACGFKPMVKHGNWLLQRSESVLGSMLTNGIVKHTFFKHFCGGETIEEVQPLLQFLRQSGLSYCLQYNVEEDRNCAPAFVDEVDSEAEQHRDLAAQRFARDIQNAENVTMRGFVAVKVSALGSPNLLQRISEHLTKRQGDKTDWGKSGSLLEELQGVLSMPELQLFNSMWQRLDHLASLASLKGNVRLMSDAEQSYLQPAIDAMVLQLQRTYNRTEPVIFNTYQCYLRDTPRRILRDLDRAKQEGYCFGAKTVRGAYMHTERRIAQEQGTNSPVWGCLEDTHHSYNGCVSKVLDRVQHEGAELMVASHNQQSVELAVEAMQARQLPRDSGVYFGTLMGMADHLAFTLGAAGYRAYKMIPYGPVPETMAYLLRRAQENSDVLGGCAKEVSMMRSELVRRLGISSLLGFNQDHAAATMKRG